MLGYIQKLNDYLSLTPLNNNQFLLWRCSGEHNFCVVLQNVI